MPYIVKTYQRKAVVTSLETDHVLLSDVAVATLDDPPNSLEVGVRGLLYAMVPEEQTAREHDDIYEQIDALTEQGGSVSLPDGTTIEVERVGFGELCVAAGLKGTDRHHDDLILDAYNARAE